MLKTIKLLSIFYTMQQFQSLTYGKLTPELNFEIFGMDENQNPCFQSPNNWTQISRVLLSRSKLSAEQPKLEQSQKLFIRHKKCQTMNNIHVSRFSLRRKSAEGDAFGHINRKVQVIDSEYPKTTINQSLITQIRALRILKTSPRVVIKTIKNPKEPTQKQVVQKKIIKKKRHKSASKQLQIPLSRMFRVKSLPLNLDQPEPQIVSLKLEEEQLKPLEMGLVHKITVLVSTNRKLSLRSIFKHQTELIRTAKFWNKIGKRRKSSYMMKNLQNKREPSPISLQKGISNGSSSGFKTPNLVENSLFSNLYKLQDMKKKYLENLKENEFEYEEESKVPDQKVLTNGRDYLKINRQIPQLQKILGCHGELKKYIGSKSPTLTTLQNSVCKKKLTVDQMLKRHVKQQKSLGVIKIEDGKMLTKTSSYTESQSQIKSLIKRQKRRKVFLVK